MTVQSHFRSDNILVRRWGLHGEGFSESTRSIQWRELMGPSARAALCYCAALVCTILVLHGALARAQGLDGSGYKLVSIHDLKAGDGVVALLELIKESPKSMSPDIKRLKLVARYRSGERLQVHITDADSERYEVPQMLLPREGVEGLETASARRLGLFGERQGSGTHALEFRYTGDPFGFAVVRRANGEVLFNTSAPGSGSRGRFNNLVFKDQYLKVSSQLPHKSVLYGLGENTHRDGPRLEHGRTYTLWSTDIGSWIPDIDLYGTYPFVMDLRAGGVAHGVALLNSNGMDVDYGDDSITFKIIGGMLDFHFFAGPRPLDVVDQCTQLVGRPASMPYWVLGFHQSRFGYKNVEHLETVMRKYKEVKIPVESIWSDIDHMDQFKDFTLDPVNYPAEKLRAFVDNLHANNQKFIMILDPGIKIDKNYSTYVRGDKLDIFIKNPTGDRFVAQVWPGTTHIPDFLHPKAQEWWSKEIAEFYKVIPFDGLWLDMNEPSNFCSGPNCHFPPGTTVCPPHWVIFECCMNCDNTHLDRWNEPPYHINSKGEHRPLYVNTVALNCEHYNGIREYDVHNLFGFSEALTTYRSLKELNGKRPFVLARSLFLGSGSHAAHWTGDNMATWRDLKYSIVGVINSGMFGVPMVGADICGFFSRVTEELCLRWTQVGAFYPFSRDHSGPDDPQEYYQWKSVAEAARFVYSWRYRLLPFLYTLMYGAHKTGAPLVRPLFFAAPEDPRTWNIGDQFLLGTDILVSPVLEAGQVAVRPYFPKGVWYNLFDPKLVVHAMNQSFHSLAAPLDTINVHVRAGAIVPMQEPAWTTAEARRTPFTLLVALAPESAISAVCDQVDIAEGELFVDDDNELQMEVRAGTATYVKYQAVRSRGRYMLTGEVTEGAYALAQGLTLQTVSVLGAQASPESSSVLVNGKVAGAATTVQFNHADSSLTINNLNLPIGKNFQVTWDSTSSDPHPSKI